MTPAQATQIKQLHANGYGVTQIAAATGFKHQTVSAHLRKTDAPRTRAQRADNGRLRKPECQLDMFGVPVDRPKRNYVKSAPQNSEISELRTPRKLEQRRALQAINPKHFIYCETVKKTVVPKRVIDSLVARFAADTGLKRVHSIYARRVFPNVLANLKRGAEGRNEIIVSMWKEIQKEQYIDAIKWLADEGLIHLQLQPPQYGSAAEKVRSWMIASRDLCQIIGAPQWEVVFDETDFVPVEIRAKKVGNETKGKLLEPLGNSSYLAACRGVIEHNKFIATAGIKYGLKPLACYLYRVYTMDFFHGGRWYGGEHQTMPKRERERITIDGLPTVELDYSAIHPALLAWITGETVTGDFYATLANAAGITRQLAKSFGLRLINANTLAEFSRNVTKSGNPAVKRAAIEWEKRKGDIKANGKPYDMPPQLDGFIEGVPDGYKGETFLDAMKQLYPRIAEMLAVENMGIKLQWHDSQIISEVLELTRKQGIIALPIHDSVIVKASDQMAAKEIMQDVFSRYTNGQIITVK